MNIIVSVFCAVFGFVDLILLLIYTHCSYHERLNPYRVKIFFSALLHFLALGMFAAIPAYVVFLILSEKGKSIDVSYYILATLVGGFIVSLINLSDVIPKRNNSNNTSSIIEEPPSEYKKGYEEGYKDGKNDGFYEGLAAGYSEGYQMNISEKDK